MVPSKTLFCDSTNSSHPAGCPIGSCQGHAAGKPASNCPNPARRSDQLQGWYSTSVPVFCQRNSTNLEEPIHPAAALLPGRGVVCRSVSRPVAGDGSVQGEMASVLYTCRSSTGQSRPFCARSMGRRTCSAMGSARYIIPMALVHVPSAPEGDAQHSVGSQICCTSIMHSPWRCACWAQRARANTSAQGLLTDAANTTTAQLHGQAWQLLLSRVGDTLMLFLLMHTSLFLPLPNGCHLQATGACVAQVLPLCSSLHWRGMTIKLPHP